MTSQTTRSWVGHTLLDSRGKYVGKVDQVYRDQETDRPTWAVVSPGGRFVPLAEANDEGDETLKIPATRNQVEAAPDVADRDRLTPDEEARLRSHYAGAADPRASNGGAPAHPARSGDADPGGGRRGAVEGARERQHEEFGGFNFGAAFFGWLVAVGIAVLLTAIVGAAGTAIGLTEVGGSSAAGNAETIGIVGGVVLLMVLVVAYYAGGYVAGRMSRFEGGRQGIGVWLFGLLVTLAAAAAGAVFGSKYNVLSKLDLPRIPVDEGSLTTAGLIALAAILIGTLLAALAGGKTGEKYHRKVDRAGYGH
jgi:sporulation protein YlmC with PRC-barrel domain